MILLDWLANYLIHSSVLLALALVTRFVPTLRDAAWQDAIWKAALLAGVVTATAQTVLPLGSTFRIGAIDPSPVVASAKPAAGHMATTAPVIATERDVSRGSLAGPARVDQVADRVTMPMPVRTPTSAVVPQATGRGDLRAIGLFAWLAGALWMLLGLGRRMVAERALLADRQPVVGAERKSLCAGQALPPSIRLSRSDAITAPLATRDREIVVPQDFDSMAADHRAAALAHEQAHIERRDPHWRLVALVLSRVFFVQPLNGLAVREISRNAEALCDRDAVRSTGGRRRPLAECLAHFAGVVDSRSPGTLCAMSAGRLPERIETLLASSDLGRARGRASAPLLIVVALTGTLLLPGISPGIDREIGPGRKGTSVEIHDSRPGWTDMSISQRDGNRSLRIKAEGRLHFDADYTDIVAIDDGGFFELRVDDGGVHRELELEGRRGELVREYEIDGRAARWDHEARAWFAETLVQVFRTSGIEVEGRVAAMVSQGGADAVIDELEMIESDLVGRLYVSALAGAASLDDRQLDAVIDYVADELGSDLETRLALSTLIERQTLDASGWAAMLDATRDVGSDLEQRLLLAIAAEHMPPDPALLEHFLAALEGINSDLERRLALSTLGDRLSGADEALMIRTIEAIGDIGSDLERRLALSSIVGHLGSHAAAEAYIDTAVRIGSDLETRLALSTLLDEYRLADDSAARLVDGAAKSIGSDLELRLLLGMVLDQHGDSPVVQDAVIDALDSIGSDFERNQIARRLLD